MTVEELIRELQDIGDPTLEVHFQYNYGDHWRTQVAPSVTRVEQGGIRHSEYHRMPKVVDEEEDNTGVTSVVLLS